VNLAEEKLGQNQNAYRVKYIAIVGGGLDDIVRYTEYPSPSGGVPCDIYDESSG
jgi:hypothetical protein